MLDAISHFHKSQRSCKSVIPPYIHIHLLWRTAECLWRGGGRPSGTFSFEGVFDTSCQESVSKIIAHEAVFFFFFVNTFRTKVVFP